MTIHTLPSIVNYRFTYAFNQKNILSGFKSTGIYPFDRNSNPDDCYLSAHTTDRPLPPPTLPGTSTSSETIIITSSDELNILNVRGNQKIVKEKVLEKCQTTLSLIGLDMKDSSNLVAPDDTELGYKAQRMLKDSKASPRQKLELRMELRAMLVAMIIKIQEKSPLSSKLARNLGWMMPSVIVKKDGKERLKNTLKVLEESNRISATECEAALKEFRDLGRVASTEIRAEFAKFDNSRLDRLDHFLAEHVKGSYPVLWGVMKTCLLLSHGQAHVERGFSLNSDISDTNMSTLTLRSKRLIEYKEYMASKREEEAKNASKRAREEEEVELKDLQEVEKTLKMTIEGLERGAEAKAEQAERGVNCHQLIVESNSLRTAKDKKQELEKLQASIKEKMKVLGGH
ncbi:hypothetical protein EGW08_015804 [Elysia chlorotica]|uniref:Uncharacterized protein n=1 Tax=Elysia chlorotica TaxID=188477 RepID=A0A3S1AZW2_ELYCH|nr:hypothetical protein EGW08_015804 [Elysia chlorotica]